MKPASGRVLREWPTMLVIAGVYGGWTALLVFHEAIPIWALLPAGAIVLGWFSSLQHEVIHGHPTPWRRINDAIGWPPLTLWLPYAIYRRSHLTHHREHHLTNPLDDPESYYVTADRWHRLGRLGRCLLVANQTLLGRLLIGPAVAMFRTWREEAVLLRQRARQRIWLTHLVGVAGVLVLAVGVAGVPIWVYGIWVYGGLSVLLLRSYAEHRAMPAPGQRTAVVEAGPFFSLLFLNNNLHVAHHARPGAAWYRLPRLSRDMHAPEIAAAGAGRYGGYGALAARYLVRPIAHPVHPSDGGIGWVPESAGARSSAQTA